MRKKTGGAGRSGSYIAEFLLKKDYEVHDIKHLVSSFNTQQEIRKILPHINIRSGIDLTIPGLVQTVAKVIVCPIKSLDALRLEYLEWQVQLSLDVGLKLTSQWLLKHQANYIQ